MSEERCLALIWHTTCECGNHWTDIEFVFKPEGQGYSYDLSFARYAALSERRLRPCGHFLKEKRVPICPGCIERLPSGWPEYANKDPDNLPHEFRWREPIARKPAREPLRADRKQIEQDLIASLLKGG